MTAGDAILEEARGDSNWAALNRTNSYQHNLIGIDKNGGIFILIANGRLEELGEIAFDHGCVTALVIDNGGSICCLQRRAPGKPLRSLLESHYWRPESVSVCVYSLKPGTSLLAAAPRQEPNFRLRSLTMRLHFRTHVGVVTRASIVARFDLEAARAAAVSIANFAVIHGASSVWIEAPEVWVKHVRAYFIERFRAARQAEDATTLRGLWLEFYLQGLFDTPFEIHAGVPSASSHGVHEPVDDRTRSDIACYSLGIDVGASAIKTALVKGDKLLKTCEVPTRPIEPHPYNSDWLSNQIQSGAQQLCQSAGIAVSDIDCIGISWAGAVRGGKAAPSKSLLDLQDVLNQTDLNIALLDRVRNLTTWIPKVLGVRGNSNVRVWNDGDVEVAAMKRPSTLLIKLGSTIAGGYTDCQGRTGYLTELGRVVIRLDPEAPRHPASRIQGTASMLIGGYALARICNERGLTTAAGQAFSNRNAGREVSELLRNGDRRGVEEVVVEMGRHMSELIIEVVDHLDDVTKILLRGGPMKGELGDLLQATILRELPETLAGIIDRDESESDSGAVAAARLASRF